MMAQGLLSMFAAPACVSGDGALAQGQRLGPVPRGLALCRARASQRERRGVRVQRSRPR